MLVRFLAATLVTMTVGVAHALPGEVLSHQKISDTAGGFSGSLVDGGGFGLATAALGDVDGNEVIDLAVGSYSNYGFTFRVWILFLNPDGTVASEQPIGEGEGGFSGSFGNEYGGAVGAAGDLDGDNVVDLLVGIPSDDDGGNERGAVWVLFLNADGTVKAEQKISSTEGGFSGALDDGDRFGSEVVALGDLDGDGIADLAVGAPGDGDGVSFAGAVWVLFLNGDGTVKDHQKISATEGGFGGELGQDSFGSGLAPLGDLDGDGVRDLAVGANGDDDGGFDQGALWVLFLNEDGTVRGHQKISETEGGFLGELSPQGGFGGSLTTLDDLDVSGVVELAVGETFVFDGGNYRGSVWVLFLNQDGTVQAHQKISDTQGGFEGVLDDEDLFGVSVASLGDLNQDGRCDLAVGAYGDDDGGEGRGAVWILFLDGAAPTPVDLAYFTANRLGRSGVIEWQVTQATQHAGFHVYREVPGHTRERISADMLSGQRSYRFVDGSAPRGEVRYWLAELSSTGETQWLGPAVLPAAVLQAPGVRVLDSEPNPFGGSTTLRYSLSVESRVRLSVLDVRGRLVATIVDGMIPAGHRSVVWDGRDHVGRRVGAGMYVVRFEVGDEMTSHKIILAE